MKKLSHINDAGHVQMVDVTDKDNTVRVAKACGFVKMKNGTLQLIEEGRMSKGNVLAAKRTGDLIPLCHPLALTGVEVEFDIDRLGSQVKILTEARTVGPTGVEMEALTAASVAALTIYDMCKAVDKEMIITGIMLLEKRGGKSGIFIRPSEQISGDKM
jgi:cyclic pyranopterin phosphate synthase